MIIRRVYTKYDRPPRALPIPNIQPLTDWKEMEEAPVRYYPGYDYILLLPVKVEELLDGVKIITYSDEARKEGL